VIYVLDASVVVTRLLGEEHAAKATQLVANARSGVDHPIAPDFFLAECGHALFRAERRKLIAAGEARRLLLALLADLPELQDTTPLVHRAAAICGHIRKSFYDCLYMALAEREQVQLVTADLKLVKAAQPDFPYVIDLASLA
jgi:predicted nucleic acid-binding protein